MKHDLKKLMTSFALCTGVLLCAALAPPTQAAGKSTPAYLNPDLPAKVRAENLVSRMTLQEKASQLVNAARAIPRLGIPSYNWWSEALHGVAVNGTTEFPEPIGLGATFDPAAIQQMGVAIGTEARVVHEQAVAKGQSTIFHGLDLWAPNINIVRDPRWGRGQETYGEDPFLTAHMAVAYVTGVQGNNPEYHRAIATPKHFAVYSGPEPLRHFVDEDVSMHDLAATYLPAFRAAIVKGHAGSIMCSYNAVKGVPACANQFLLGEMLRGKWGFKGYVVSDCDAVHDIFTGHHYRPTQAQATAISMERGMDNECADFTTPSGDEDYKPFVTAVQKGYLSQSAMDQSLVRLFTARIKLGLFAPKGSNPYANTPYSELDSPAHRALALKLADESMVLLKNDGILPLKPTIHSIAVVGPLADQTHVLLGNYAGVPTHTVSILEGLKADFPTTKITYVPGTQFLGTDIGHPVPTSVLTTPEGKPGLKAEYMKSQGSSLTPGSKPKPVLSRVESGVDLNKSTLPGQLAAKKKFGVEWSGFLMPTRSGTYLIGVKANGFATISVNGKAISRQYGEGARPDFGYVHLQRGEKVSLSVHFEATGTGKPHAQLLWTPVDGTPSPAAVAAARKADAVIAVVGLSSQLEGEQMPVDRPGFRGGDKTTLKMPEPELALVKAVASTGKPVIVVLLNGSALAVNWINQHVNAIVEAWYPGEEGGTAVADTLVGKNNPAGRLDETFYKSVNQLPNFENYSMKGRTYRYFKGEPLYPFGYGLSYTSFAYSNLRIAHRNVNAGDPVDASVTVTNTGKVAGDEVVQLYLEFPSVSGAPRLALRGFRRIHLEPGQGRQVKFELKGRALGMVTAVGQPIIAAGGYTVSIGGGQPGTGAPGVSGHFHVDNQIALAR